jgi:2-hydroxy-6-oxonona-2,4-dienedioate hydrolase
MKAAFLDVNGVRTRFLYTNSTQDRRPLVLLHAFGFSADLWVRNLDVLGEHRPVYAPDLLGNGFTQPLPLEGDAPHGMTKRHLLDWIDAMGWQEFDLAGSSFGGLVAALMYFDRPFAVRRLVLIGSGSCFSTEAELERAVQDVKANGLSAIGDPSRESCRKRLSNLLVNDDCVPEEVILASLTSYAMPGVRDYFVEAMDGMANMSALRRYRVFDRLEELKLPTLVIWGRQDRRGSHEGAAAGVARIPDADFEVFDACGHLPYVEQAEAFNAAVTLFLQEEAAVNR